MVTVGLTSQCWEPGEKRHQLVEFDQVGDEWTSQNPEKNSPLTAPRTREVGQRVRGPAPSGLLCRLHAHDENDE